MGSSRKVLVLEDPRGPNLQVLVLFLGTEVLVLVFEL